MTAPLALSPHAAASLHRFGAERQPLVVIDGLLTRPQAVLDIAAKAPFQPIGPHYPGVRSPVPAGAIAGLIAALGADLHAAFALPAAPRLHECFLSVVTTAPAGLAVIQRLPHFDGLDEHALALLLYLDPAERAGTAFYRQRATGFESVNASRHARFSAELAGAIAAHGPPPPGYISGSTPVFEQTFRIVGRFNRAVVYRSNTLHCADIPPGFTAPPAPAAGRLTLNLFLHAP